MASDEIQPPVYVHEEETIEQLNAKLLIRKMPSLRLTDIYNSVCNTNNTIINLDSLLLVPKSYDKIPQPKGSQNNLPPFQFYQPLQYTPTDKVLYTILMASLRRDNNSNNDEDDDEDEKNNDENSITKYSSCIKTLSLRYNNLSIASTYILYRYLQVNDSLTMLYLSNTNIQDNIKNWLYNEWKKKMIGHRQESFGYIFIRINENDKNL